MIVGGGKDYSFLLTAPGQLEALFQAYKVTLKHPVLKLPTAEWVVQTLRRPDGRAILEKGLEDREKLIELMVKDPLRYGFKPQMWKDADALLEEVRSLFITGPNRTGKTEYAADKVVRILTEIPNARAWCACETNETSIRGGGQQEVIWKYLPPEWKALNGKRGSDKFSIGYTPKNRFTDNAFVGPNGSECRFMNYEQKIEVIEGGAIDVFWFDELAPVEWIVTAEGRLVDRDGNGMVTFTPIRGWNDAYGLFAQGGTVKRWQEFPLFKEMVHYPGGKPGMVPYILESMDPQRAMIFFRPGSNPYIDWDALVKLWSSASYEVQMIRLAGLARKKVGNRFPKFSKVHILPAAKIPKEGTNYHFIDFAWERNWAQIWVRVRRIKDKLQFFVYRDWPDRGTHGEWVVPASKPNGERGPAQSSVGLSISGYKQLMRQLEGHGKQSKSAPREPEEIFQRYGDPRSGKAPALTADAGGTCIFDLMGEAQKDAPAMDVQPARGLQVGEGINIINELLDYNEEEYQQEGRLTPMNEPRLFISEECQQVIDCMNLWTGQGSEKEQASKDFIDLLRYMATADLDDYPPGTLGSSGGGSY